MRVVKTRTRCPFCKAEQDRATDIKGTHTPRPGDFAICFDCGEVSVFTKDDLRKPTKQERRQIATDDHLQAALFAWRLRH